MHTPRKDLPDSSPAVRKNLSLHQQAPASLDWQGEYQALLSSDACSSSVEDLSRKAQCWSFPDMTEPMNQSLTQAESEERQISPCGNEKRPSMPRLLSSQISVPVSQVSGEGYAQSGIQPSTACESIDVRSLSHSRILLSSYQRQQVG